MVFLKNLFGLPQFQNIFCSLVPWQMHHPVDVPEHLLYMHASGNVILKSGNFLEVS